MSRVLNQYEKMYAALTFNKGLSQENSMHNQPSGPDCHHPQTWIQKSTFFKLGPFFFFFFYKVLFPESSRQKSKPKLSPKPQHHLIPFITKLVPVSHVAKLHPNNKPVWLKINSIVLVQNKHNDMKIKITLCIKNGTQTSFGFCIQVEILL